MKKFLPILLLFMTGCSQNDAVDKEQSALSIKNYYMQAKEIKSIDDLSIDSVVAVTEKKQLEKGIVENEKRYYYFIEAKDDEYADSTAKDIEKMQQRLKKADDNTLIYYTVYHTLKFTGNDLVKRRRQSNLDVTLDYKIRPNAVTERDKIEGIKGEQLYKQYSY